MPLPRSHRQDEKKLLGSEQNMQGKLDRNWIETLAQHYAAEAYTTIGIEVALFMMMDVMHNGLAATSYKPFNMELTKLFYQNVQAQPVEAVWKRRGNTQDDNHQLPPFCMSSVEEKCRSEEHETDCFKP